MVNPVPVKENQMTPIQEEIQRLKRIQKRGRLTMKILETLAHSGKTIEIYRDERGNFRFRVKARNGEIVLVSEAYVSKWNAKRGAKTAVGAKDAKGWTL
jgi:uncharacterized protein YegP (UPF0339 family)